MKPWDLAIIGAGIHGVAVARAAAYYGWRVLLVEARGVAAGTSSRSSKLIHGGLRYLESGRLGLVRECLAERRALLAAYPGLVRLVPHYLPVYPWTRRRPARLAAGLALYALLGGLGSDTRFGRLPPACWGRLDGLRQRGLQTVWAYLDAQTHDRALTQVVADEAVAAGAELRMPAECIAGTFDGEVWRLRLRVPGRTQEVCAARLVNAAGPWVNDVLERLRPTIATAAVDLVQGTHLILDAPLMQGVYYVEAEDTRAVFIMPWHRGQTLIGTTEIPYRGDPQEVSPLASEREYLMATLLSYFPRYRGIQVVDAYAGLRVLPVGDDRPFGRSRETQLRRDLDGRLLSIIGGKLTAHRATARRVVSALASAGR